jgi:gamma-glutamyltranspeptidase/glutathione hydrolase
MVSWVNSNFAGFGSGITVPGYGFILHNRGSLFTLNPNSPNLIMPQKRPYNTLSAGFVAKGDIRMAFQLMGGDMQSQGHMQVLVNMIDLGANLQAATDMARFFHSQVPNTLSLETELYNLVGPQLAAMGHKVNPTNGGAVGGYQALMFTRDPTQPTPQSPGRDEGAVNGFYRAGSDHRKDGEAVGW